MARLVSSKCPHCGAPLQVSPEASEVVCAYCQQTALIQRPNQPVRVPTPERPVIQLSTGVSKLPIIFAVVGFLSVGMTTAIASFLMAAPDMSGTSAPSILDAVQQVAKPRSYFSDAPFLFDVNGDGVLDILGKSNVPGGVAWIAAYDGRDGNELWKSQDLPKDATEGMAFRTLVGDTFISVDALGKAQAYDAKTGQPRWATLLGETVRDACAGPGFVRLSRSDRQTQDLDPTSGKAVEKAPKDCASVTTSNHQGAVGSRLIGWSEFDDWGIPGLHSVEGLSAHRALVLDDRSQAFLLGSKAAGSQVAMIARVKGKKVLWKDVVPGVDPLSTKVNVTTQNAAYSSGKVVVPYQMRDSDAGVRVALFDAETGRREWDVELHKKTQVDGGLALTATHVYVGSWTALYVLDAKTGERRFLVGSEF